MRVVVDFQDERLDLDLPDDRVVAVHRGPSGVSNTDRVAATVEALERPLDFPPFSAMFVPGDRVAIALDSRLPEAADALSAMLPILKEATGESGEITVVATPGGRGDLASAIPQGINFSVHDPTDRDRLAYLASTRTERRIYLNRHLTDADAVIPVGEIGFDPMLGCRGPWSVIYPGLSDLDSRKVDRASAPRDSRSANVSEGSSSRVDESSEVGWLLGSQFSVGFLPGASGFATVVAGLATSVRDYAVKALERDWDFRPDSRADLVVAGVGRPGVATGLEALAAAISTAADLVQHGGKIVILSRAQGELGPSLRRLIDAGEPRRGAAALKGHEADEDYEVASRISKASNWADIYLLSGLDPQTVEDLSITPLGRPQEAARLLAGAFSCILLSHAELTRARVADDS